MNENPQNTLDRQGTNDKPENGNKELMDIGNEKSDGLLQNEFQMESPNEEFVAFDIKGKNIFFRSELSLK